MDVVQTPVALKDPLRLLIQLVENQRGLVLNLHSNLQTRAVFVRQDLDDYRCYTTECNDDHDIEFRTGFTNMIQVWWNQCRQ